MAACHSHASLIVFCLHPTVPVHQATACLHLRLRRGASNASQMAHRSTGRRRRGAREAVTAWMLTHLHTHPLNPNGASSECVVRVLKWNRRLGFNAWILPSTEPWTYLHGTRPAAMKTRALNLPHFHSTHHHIAINFDTSLLNNDY